MYHCYLIPYTIRNKKIYVLIGRKLCYSSKDGFIHNNPGQLVFIGGHCKKSVSDDKLIKSSIREFVEETGNYINKNNIALKRYNEFSVSFYRISGEREYNFFKNISSGAHEKYKELNELHWVSLNKAIEIMDQKTKKNLPCGGKLEQSVHKYIKDWSNNNWSSKTEMKNLKRYLEGKLRTQLSHSQYNSVREEIRKNLRKSQNYNLLVNYLIKEFNKRSYTDWYGRSAVYLGKNIEKINNDINGNVQKRIQIPLKTKSNITPTPANKSKSPAKKVKSPAKKVKSPVKKAKSPAKVSAKAPVKRKFQVRRVAIKQSPQRKSRNNAKPKPRGRFERY